MEISLKPVKALLYLVLRESSEITPVTFEENKLHIEQVVVDDLMKHVQSLSHVQLLQPHRL